MEYNVNNAKVLKFLISIVVIVLLILILIVIRQKGISADIEKTVAENIASTGWPKDVPIIKNELLDIEKYSNSANPTYVVWSVDIPKGVSYVDFKNYLIELDNAGFKAIELMGSKSPHLLTDNPYMDSDFFNIWYGKTEDYKIEVSWRNVVEESDSKEEDVFSITLSTLKKSSDNEISGDNLEENLNSGDSFILSGDVSGASGDTIILSGEILDISGDFVISGDEKLTSGETFSGEILE